MNHPQVILAALDRHLERPTRVILYGRAALALSWAEGAAEMGVTLDVDALLPSVEMEAIESDAQFWRALDLANLELAPQGLYMTHLFSDDQVILTPGWLAAIVPILGENWRWLRVFRPSTVDLILTKMMRDDPQDLADIGFLLRQESLGAATMRAAVAAARVPNIEEIRGAFLANQPRVLALANAGSPGEA